MKVTIVLFSLLLSAALASADDFTLDKGAIELGGELTFSSSSGDLYENSDGEAMTEFSLFPMGFYFVKPGLGIGGVLLFATASQGDASASILGIGPGVIYYFGDSTFNTRPFVSGAFMYSSEKLDLSYVAPSNPGTTLFHSETNTGTTIHLEVGIANILVDHFIIKSSLFYEIENQEQEGDWYTTESQPGNTFGITIGFAGIIY